MNIKDSGACRAIAERIRGAKKKNPLTVGEDMDITMSVYRKDQPEEKCGTLRIHGALDLSLFKLGALITGIVVAVRAIGFVKKLLRK